MVVDSLLTAALPLFSSFFSLSSKELLKSIGPDSYTGYVLLGSAVLSYLYNRFTGIETKFNGFSIASGLAFGIATLMFEQGLRRTANPGLANAMYRSQTALTAVASVFLLGSSMSPIGMLGVFITVLGAGLVALDSEERKDHHVSKEGFETQTPGAIVHKHDRKGAWIPLVLIAGVLLTVKDLTAVKSLANKAMKPSSYVVSQTLFGALIVLLYKVITQGTLMPTMHKKGKELEVALGMTAVSIDNFLWCAVLVYLMSVAKNPAYPKAVTMLGIGLTSVVSSYFLKGAKLDDKQWGGIVAILAGVGMVILG
jgi:drug/metabolite transporter (DMT)-like permease